MDTTCVNCGALLGDVCCVPSYDERGNLFCSAECRDESQACLSILLPGGFTHAGSQECYFRAAQNYVPR